MSDDNTTTAHYYTALDKLKNLLEVLEEYGVIPILSCGEKDSVCSTVPIDEVYNKQAGLFYGQILSSLEHHERLAKNRLITTQDWWFNDEIEYGLKDALDLKHELVFELPNKLNDTNAIGIEAGEDKVVVRYKGVDLSGRFPFGLGIHAVNHLLMRMDSPLRIIEIVDLGEDFAAYAVSPESRVDQLRDKLVKYIFPGKLTDYQSEIENEYCAGAD